MNPITARLLIWGLSIVLKRLKNKYNDMTAEEKAAFHEAIASLQGYTPPAMPGTAQGSEP